MKHIKLFWFLAILGIILLECFCPVFLLISHYGGLPRPFQSSFDRSVLSLMPTLYSFMLFSFIGGTLFVTGGLLGVARQYRKIENEIVTGVFLTVILIMLFLLYIIFMYTFGT